MAMVKWNEDSRNEIATNLVPRASFPLTSGRKTRALGAAISGMRHRCRCAVNQITRIRLFPLFFHNGCSQSSRFPTAGQRERSSGNEIGLPQTRNYYHMRKINFILRSFPSKVTRHRFPMKLRMLLLQHKEILKT